LSALGHFPLPAAKGTLLIFFDSDLVVYIETTQELLNILVLDMAFPFPCKIEEKYNGYDGDIHHWRNTLREDKSSKSNATTSCAQTLLPIFGRTVKQIIYQTRATATSREYPSLLGQVEHFLYLS
jgi:hypothetical protein